MVAPPLTDNVRKILDELQENVAPHILAALRMDDVTRIDITYHESLVFEDMSFMLRGTRVLGGITICQRKSGKFDVLLYPIPGRPEWVNNLSGAGLEDLIIELADI